MPVRSAKLLQSDWRTDPVVAAKVRALRDAGIAVSDIARRFGRSTDWVRTQAANALHAASSSQQALSA